MSEQAHLFDPPPATGQLTERQRFVYDLLAEHPVDGLSSDEVGAALCERSGRHDRGTRCDWDATNGVSVLKALRKKGLAKRRRAGGWVALHAAEPVSAPEAADPFPEGY